MRPKLLALAIALACLAAPLATLAADDCSPCCAHSAPLPCERGQGSCTTVGSTPCCDAVPVAPAPPALRLLESPASPACQSGDPLALAPAPGLRGRAGGSVASPLSSPLRLSVVLRI